MIGKIMLLALIIGVVGFLCWFLISLIVKDTAVKRRGKDVWFPVSFIPHRIRVPSVEKSKYKDLFPKKTIPLVYHNAPTIDDEVLKEIVRQMESRIGKRSDRYKARYILSFVQMAIRYSKDGATYGVSEKYAFPCCTLHLRQGDCEDMALLGAGLSRLMGLDVIVIHVEGHVAYGVNVDGFGKKVEFDGKKYLWAEPTGIFPLGCAFNDRPLLGCYYPKTPEEYYINLHTYEDSFDKYL